MEIHTMYDLTVEFSLERILKMSNEKNELSVYNQLDIIKNALAQIETIHVYELANRQFGNSTEDELKQRIRELDKEILEYELQLAENQSYIDSVLDANKRLLEANNKLIAEKNLALENRQLTQDQADQIIAAYNKLPRVVKKFYGVD